jgi:methyl-accepting chemotaxis protein
MDDYMDFIGDSNSLFQLSLSEQQALLVRALKKSAIAVIIFRLPLLEFRRELQLLIAGMRSLLQGNRSNLHNKMLVLSLDEIGQLGLAFEKLFKMVGLTRWLNT